MTVAFLTSTRADYGKLRPLLLATPRPVVIACGTHLDHTHGDTLVEVGHDASEHGWRVEVVHSAVAPVAPAGMADAAADVCRGVARKLDGVTALVVHGDRVEAMGGALAAALANVPVVHVEAGDVSGGLDDALRAAITPLASVHVVRDEASRQRLVRRGVDATRIRCIPVAPCADMPSLAEVRARYAIPDWPRFGILALHPVTTGEEPPDALAREVCAACVESGLPFVVIGANSDRGSHLIEREYLSLPPERFRRLPSLRHAHFARLLAEAAVIVGNSSAGVIEAPMYGTPSVDVGVRQKGRGEAHRVRASRDAVLGGIGWCVAAKRWPAKAPEADSWASVLGLVNGGGST